VWPSWAPKDPDEAKAKLRKRVTDVVSHFKGLIDRWDVVNEATVSAKTDTGVGAWVKRDGAAAVVAECLKWARGANGKATLLYNDFNTGADMEKLLADLQKAKAPFDAIGIQSHMHNGETPLAEIWAKCETYAKFGLPLHFTELTVLSGEHGWNKPAPWPTTPEGEARQAEYVEKLYALLFSHPSVEAVTWWDLMDGGWMGAPAGLIRADYSPKPAYERLMRLIKGKWWTRTSGVTDRSGKVTFRGFLGTYRVSVVAPEGNGSRGFELKKGDKNTVRLELKTP
jgi:endo-1,4-beta-xylanase